MHTMVTDGTSKLEAGMELLVTRWIGLEGTARIAAEKEALLLEKFPWALVREARSFESYMNTEEEEQIVSSFPKTECFPLGEGGILSALWQMADRAGLGLTADLRKIPIRQETVEICELFDVNPYNLASKGALLVGTFSAMAMAEELNRAKIPAVIIGRVNEGSERILYNQEIKRYIDKPQKDELYKIFG